MPALQKERLTWTRPRIDLCKCGSYLCTIPTVKAQKDILALNAVILFTIGIGRKRTNKLIKKQNVTQGFKEDSIFRKNSHIFVAARFPPAVAQFSLHSLLRLIRLFGFTQPKLDGMKVFQRFTVERAVIFESKASTMLLGWPRGFRAYLKGRLPEIDISQGLLGPNKIYGIFYRRLLYDKSYSEFNFVRNEFEKFVSQKEVASRYPDLCTTVQIRMSIREAREREKTGR
jgi:hypothetical protein